MSRKLKSRIINVQPRKRILQCYIWSTFLYGCETWILTKTMESKLEAFEMWAYRRTLRVSGMDGTLNGKYSKFIIANNKEKKMPIFWTHNKREVDPKILTGRQN